MPTATEYLAYLSFKYKFVKWIYFTESISSLDEERFSIFVSSKGDILIQDSFECSDINFIDEEDKGDFYHCNLIERRIDIDGIELAEDDYKKINDRHLSLENIGPIIRKIDTLLLVKKTKIN